MGPSGNPLENGQGVSSVDRAAELSRSGQGEEARALLEALARGPWVESASEQDALRAARMCAELGALQDALRILETRSTASTPSSEWSLLWARLLVRRAFEAPGSRSECLRRAEHCLRATLSETPTEASAHALLGLVLDRQGRFQEAVEAWRCAFVLAPKDLDYRTGLAVSLSACARYREAIPFFESVCRARPERPEVYINLGLALRAYGELERALSEFERAAELKPNWARAQIDIGLTHRKLGRLELALAAFEKAIALQPESAHGHHHKGALLLRWGRLEEAEVALVAARTRAPNDPEIRRSLIELAQTPSNEDDDTVAILNPLEADFMAEVSRFGVPEIVEFLGMVRRTGLLEVGGPTGPAHIEFVEGRVLSGRVVGQPSFLERLIEAGVRIPPGFADFDIGQGAGLLIQLLLEEGIGDRELFEKIAFESSVEAVLALLELREGRAEFRGRLLTDPSQDVRLLELGVEAQGVLLEAHRRLDESGRA